MQQALSIALFIIIAPFAAYATPATAAGRNACYVETLARGQYIVQTDGTTGTITAYVDGAAKTTISRKNQRWYVTSDKEAIVRGYDSNGLVC